MISEWLIGAGGWIGIAVMAFYGILVAVQAVRYFMTALKLVYGDSRFEVEGLGAQGRCTMIHQPDRSRYCINMAYASPVKRGKAEVIEDIMTLYDIHVELKISECVKKVYLGVTGEELAYTVDNGRVDFVVPQLHCHASIVVAY